MRQQLVRVRRGASDRRFRLVAAAACRRRWDALDDAARRQVEAAEAYADGVITRGEFDAAFGLAGGFPATTGEAVRLGARGLDWADLGPHPGRGTELMPARVMFVVANAPAIAAAGGWARIADVVDARWRPNVAAEYDAQADLVRDRCGDRPAGRGPVFSTAASLTG